MKTHFSWFYRSLLFCLLTLILTQCQKTKEEGNIREIQLTHADYSFKILKPMVFYDATERQNRTKGVRLNGSFVFEGMDEQFFYFRSTNKLEYRLFSPTQTTAIRELSGGIFIRKNQRAQQGFGGTYIDLQETSQKMLVFEFNHQFIDQRDVSWESNIPY